MLYTQCMQLYALPGLVDLPDQSQHYSSKPGGTMLCIAWPSLPDQSQHYPSKPGGTMLCIATHAGG